jgi:oligopeptide transport system substrate-binding protein
MLIRDCLKSFLVLTALLVPLALALYAGFSASFERADFVFVNQGEVSSLDPARATGIPEGRILMAVSEGLTSLHPETLEALPACAESWEISRDGRTIRFRMRPGLKWSDGTPLTAGDFLYSWMRLLDPATASPYAYLLWHVDGAKRFTERTEEEGSRIEVGLEAPDERTLIVRLEKVCTYFPILTAFYPLYPVNAECIRSHGEARWLRPENLVSNGPFRVKARLLKDRIRLEKSPSYWDADRVKVDRIDALAITSPMTALNLYLTGEVDWINHVPPIVLPFVKEREDFTLTPNLGTNFLRFNVTVAPLDDRCVRTALHLAIDRADLVDHVLKGGQKAADSFVPPGIPGYRPGTCENFDPDRARELLAEAGFPGGAGFPELNLLYSADETNRDIAEVIAMQLRRNLGIRLHPAAQERKGYFVSQNTLAYHLCLCSWLGDYLDPTTFLDIFQSGSGNNRTGWACRKYDALLEQAANELVPEVRAALLQRAETALLNELPIAPLFFRTTANMIKGHWEGYHDNIQDVHPLKYIGRKDR